MPRRSKPVVETPNDSHEVATVPARQRHVIDPKDKGLGGMAYADKTLATQFAQPIDTQGKTTREKWANTAYVLALRAKKAAQTYSKKDFNALYRLVLSAGIAFDKAFPTRQEPLGGNLVVQLFGSLGEGVAKRILEPVHPTIDITPVEYTEVETPNEKPLVGVPTDIVTKEE